MCLPLSPLRIYGYHILCYLYNCGIVKWDEKGTEQKNLTEQDTFFSWKICLQFVKELSVPSRTLQQAFCNFPFQYAYPIDFYDNFSQSSVQNTKAVT